jgi:hypothetical protein
MARRNHLLALGALAIGTVVVVPHLVAAQSSEGFDGFIQGGPCAAPTDRLRVQLEGDGDHDAEPYLARSSNSGDTVLLGYYGSAGVPGFGFSAIYTDQRFSLVVVDTGGDAVACGDILEPDADRFGESGLALVQLLPIAGSGVQGMASIERAELQREHDVTPTRVRLLLSVDASSPTTAETGDGYDGMIQGMGCDQPVSRLRVDLKSRGDHDVRPYLAKPDDGGEPVTLAYYGAPLAPGFGLATVHTDTRFSLAITDTDNGAVVGCGDILRPDDNRFTEAGLALVQVQPVGENGVQGYAMMQRMPMQRELDVTPTRARVLLFAPPVDAG